MAAITRPRLPSINIHHTRNMSTATDDSDSSVSSPDRENEEETEYFMLHANDSQSSVGGMTAFRDCEMELDLEQAHRLSPISKLPPELLIAIFSKLTSTADLRNCMLVSYHWALYTVGLLWHRPLCNKWPNLQNVARTLADVRPTFPYHEMVRRLNLSSISDKVNNGTVQAFITCKGIERLTLTNCSKLTDLGVEGLVDGSKRLQALDVTDLDALTDRTLHRVANNCPKLQGLNISNCINITDESLVAIAESCTQLKRLKLNGIFRATDISITAVARNCRSILEIDLAGCQSITSESVTALLSNLTHLRELRLAHCIDINDFAFTNLSPTLSFEALRILDLTACEGVRDDAISRIIPAAPRLRNLVLAKCRHITDQAVLSICKLTKNLHYIHLGHCTNLTDAAVISLVRHCNRIRYIDLACCSRLTDASVRHLAQLPKLRRIGLVKCQNLTDASIIALARGPYGSGSAKAGMPTQFVSLERVHLSYCVNLTLKGITQLLLNCPRLTHLSLTGVQAFLREDLTRFCRDAPPEFTHPQRDVFCVFSGDGVTRLREYLRRLAMEEAEREQQNAIEERLLGDDSPEVDSMSDDGTIDGNDHVMDFVYGHGRRSFQRSTNPRSRPRPRSLHDLPSFHVDMPLFPADQMQRVGPWTPSAPLTPEMRATLGPAHLNLMSSSNLWYPDAAVAPRSRSPLPSTGFSLGPSIDEQTRSRSQSRRHTLESSNGLFGPAAPSMHTYFESNSRIFDTAEDLRRTTSGSSNMVIPPLPSRRSGAQIPSMATRQSSLRPNPGFSTFEANHDAIMATIPGSRGPSRSNSPHMSRVSSRSRMGNFWGAVRAMSSSPFHAEIATRSGRAERSREASRQRDEAMLHAMAARDAAELLRPDTNRTASSLRRPDFPLLPPGLEEQIPDSPVTSTDSPEDTGFEQMTPGATRHNQDVHMTH